MGERKISELFYELRAKTEGLDKDLKDSERQLARFAAFVKANPTAAVGAFTLALAGVGIEATKMAEEVESATRRMAVNLPEGARGMETLKEGISKVSAESGKLRAETQALFETISKQGAASAEEIVAKASAIQKFSDATNSNTDVAAAGLKQLQQLFGVTVDGSELALAKIAAVSKGKVNVESVTAALAAAAPAVAKYGLSFDTTLKAIIGLLQDGVDPEKIARLLRGFDKEGFEEAGKNVHIPSDALKELNERADLAREGLDRLANKSKNDLAAAMEELGSKLLPLVVKEMQGLAGILDVIDGTVARIRGKTNLGTINTLGRQTHLGDDAKQQLRDALDQVPVDIANGTLNLPELPLNQLRDFYSGFLGSVKLLGQENDKVFQGILTNTAALIVQKKKLEEPPPSGAGDGTGGRRLPLSATEKAAAETALTNAQKAVTEFGVSVQRAIAGTTTSAVDNAVAQFTALAVKIQEVRSTIVKAARLPGADTAALDAQRKQLDTFAQQALEAQRQVIARLTQEERTTIRDNVAAAAAAATGSAAESARQAVEHQTTALLKQINASNVLDEAEKNRLRTEVAITDAMGHATAEATAAAERIAATIAQIELSQSRGQLPGVGNLNQLNAESLNASQQMRELEAKGLKNSQAYRDYQQQIVTIEQQRQKILALIAGQVAGEAKDAERDTALIQEQARVLQQAADGAVQLAEAFGLVDRNVGNVLRSVTQVATGIRPLVDALKNFHSGALGSDGKPLATFATVIGAALPIAGGLASLISASGFFGNSAKDEAFRRTMEQNTLALQKLTGVVGLLGSNSLTGNQATAGAAVATQLHAGGIAGDNVFARLAAIRALTPAQIADLTEAAKQYGITLDGTVDSYQRATTAILSAAGKLGEFGDDFQSFTDQAAAARQIFGKDNPAQVLTDLAASAQKASPAIAKLFEGLDLAKPEDLETLRKRIQDFFTVMEAGGEKLSEADLGSLTGSQLVQFLENVISGIDALTPRVETVAQVFASAADIIAAAASQLQTDFDVLGTDAQGQLDAKAGLYSKKPMHLGPSDVPGGTTDSVGGGFPEIAAALSGIDLHTAAGRDAAKAALRTVYLANRGNKPLTDAILDLLHSIDAIPADTGASDAGASPDGHGQARDADLRG
jgi:hypothetical protein